MNSNRLNAYLATASLSTPRDIQEEICIATGWQREYVRRAEMNPTARDLNLTLAARMAERLSYLRALAVAA